MTQLITRRDLATKALAAATGLFLATALPAPPAAAASGHMGGCGAPFGPLHRYLYNTAPDPYWQDLVIWRESNWTPGAYNRSGASGLAQFMPSTWAWGEERFGVYGSPFDPFTAIDMMNNFIAAGEYYHWSETAPW